MREIVLSTLVLFSLCACIKDSNPPIPAYIHVEGIDLEIQDGSQGSASHKIRDAWVTVNGQLIGVKDLPVTLPVIMDDTATNGEHTVKVRGGIYDNGISTSRIAYLFYEPYTERVQLEAGKIDTINATVHYDDDAIIKIVEDFESTGHNFGEDIDGNINTDLDITSSDVFEGAASGKINIDTFNTNCVVATSISYSNLQPSNTSFPVYLEFDYRTNNTFKVGIQAVYANGSKEILYKGGVNPSSGWNKIYFNLTNDIYGLGASSYAIVFSADLDADVEEAEILIDNIKLLHY